MKNKNKYNPGRKQTEMLSFMSDSVNYTFERESS